MDSTTLILSLCGGIGGIFLVVIIMFVLLVRYYYKKKAGLDEEEIYDRAGSGISSRSGSILPSSSSRPNNVQMESAHSTKEWESESSASITYESVEVINQEMWKHLKGDDDTVTHNPAFNQEDVQLFDNLGFDKENSEDEDLDSGLADVSTVEDENKEVSNFENAANEHDSNQSDQIQILNMTTWSQPASSPTDQRMPFTISSKVSRGELNKEEYTVDFTKANPLTHSMTKLNRKRPSSVQRSHSQSVVDFYESANSNRLRSNIDLPADAYGTGRRLLWKKNIFDSK